MEIVTPKKHVQHQIGEIRLQQYNNRSWGYWNEDKRWVNIPSELGEKLYLEHLKTLK